MASGKKPDQHIAAKKNKRKKGKVSGDVGNRTQAAPNATNATNAVAEDVTCPTCHKSVPRQNLSLHQLRCDSIAQQRTAAAVRPKQKPMVKPLPKIEPETEDVDQLLSQFRQLDSICRYATCKTAISLYGQTCQLCLRRFCLSHHLPEIHGCADQARRQARSASLKQGMIPTTPSKKLDASKRAQLHRKLDQKIQNMSTKRAGTLEKKK